MEDLDTFFNALRLNNNPSSSSSSSSTINNGRQQLPPTNSGFLRVPSLQQRISNVCRIVRMELSEGNLMLFNNAKGCDFFNGLLEVSDDKQRFDLLLGVANCDCCFHAICCHEFGNRSLVKMAHTITREEEKLCFMNAMEKDLGLKMFDPYGYRVVIACLESFSGEENTVIFEAAALNLTRLAMDKVGCVVVQRCLNHLPACILSKLFDNLLDISLDRHGNYVTQSVLEKEVPQLTRYIIMKLEGTFSMMSAHEYGSRVVERCLKVANKEELRLIVFEIADDPDFATNVLDDKFGNFVVQTALVASSAKDHSFSYTLLAAVVDQHRGSFSGSVNAQHVFYKKDKLDEEEYWNRRLRPHHHKGC